MNIEKGEISSSQLMFLILCFIQSAHLTAVFIYHVSKHDTWLCVIAGFGVSLVFSLIYIALAQKFPGKNLIQIYDSIYGQYLGKLFSILFIFFFLLVIAPNLYYFSNFWLTYIMPETPRLAILIMFVFVCVWAVRNGIEVIARCSFLLVIITAASILIVTVLLLKDMKFTYFLPVFEIPLKDFVQSTHIVVSIPFCEIVVFLMVIPYTNNIKQAKKSVLLGLTLGAIQLLVIVARDTAVLGPIEDIAASPPFGAVRQIDIAKILTRLDILVAIALLVTMFIKVCVFFYATALGIAQLFNLQSYVQMVIPIGIISISFAMQIHGSAIEQAYVGANSWPFFTIPFEFLIPLISLLIAKMRRLPEKQGRDSR